LLNLAFYFNIAILQVYDSLQSGRWTLYCKRRTRVNVISLESILTF